MEAQRPEPTIMPGRSHARDLALAIYIPLLATGVTWCLLTPGTSWLMVAALAVAGTVCLLMIHSRQRRFLDGLATAIENMTYDNPRRRSHPDTQNLGSLGAALRRLGQHTQGQQAQLFQARDQALRAAEQERDTVRNQSAFLAQISHEIRTPMTAILGFSDVMLDPETSDEERVTHAGTIRSSSEHLLTLLNDLLDLAKVEAGRMTVERVPCSPHTIVRDAVSMLEETARNKGIQLTVEYPEPVPQSILSDPTRLRQVLVNLISNAVKFTEKGGVKVITRVKRGSDRKHRIIFEVHDSGIGMTPDEVGSLFQPFMQARTDISRKYGGTGLGLCIARQLAGLLGGTLDVRSQKGRGTVFTVSAETGSLVDVPMVVAALPEAPEVPEPGRPRTLGGRVLVAEDVRDVRNLIYITLSSCHADVTTVDNGQLAVEKVLSAQQRGIPYDVVLMDLHMPVKNGDHAVAEIREGGFEGPIIALTAHAAGEEFDSFMASGCTSHFNKPFHRDDLIRFLAAFLPGDGDEAPRPEAPVIQVRKMNAPTLHPVAETETDATETPVNELPGEALVSSFAEDADMAELVQEFLKIIPAQIEALEAALSASDLDKIRAVAHQLKGAAGTFGYDVISEVAAELERTVRELGTSEEIEEHATSLLDLLERALLMLETT